MLNPVFIGHGSPMNAIQDNAYTRFLGEYGRALSKPEAVVVISAHWQTRGTWITGGKSPEQIYDFYGFPEKLFQLRYTAQGSPEIADWISKTVNEIQVNPDRGIDHAAWAVLHHVFPEQNIPVLELSLDRNKTPEEHFLLGKKLSLLSGRNILVMGSGNIVHNLREASYDDRQGPFDWAIQADAWMAGCVEREDFMSLVNFQQAMPDFRRAIPTDEHYLPFLTILGMKEPSESVKTLYHEIQNGNISMRCFEIRK